MATKKVLFYTDFSNVDEVFDKMLEQKFFVNEAHRDEAKTKIESTHETWYSNGVVEVKIFRGLFGSYELRNYRGMKHKDIDELFAVAAKPKL